MKKLTGKQVRFLRGLGHHLQPVLMLGKDGISSQVITATDEALTAHELIKVRLQEGCMIPRRDAAAELAAASKAEVAQILGKTFLLFRRSDDPKITLP